MSIPDINDTDWKNHVARAGSDQRHRLFHAALRENRLARVDYLLTQGIDLTERRHFELLGSYVCAIQTDNPAILKALVARGLDISAQVQLESGLRHAIKGGHMNMMRYFLNRGADPQTGLALATLLDQPYIIDALLRAGADMDAEKENQLGLALERRAYKSAKALILHGAALDVRYKHMTAATRIKLEDIASLKILAAALSEEKPVMTRAEVEAQSLSALRDRHPLHPALTGFQLAAYNGHFDVIIDKMKAARHAPTRSDFICATPENPQTVLHILGRQNSLSLVFDPALWTARRAAMLQTYHYVPARFTGQIDLQKLQSAFAQTALKLKKPQPYRLNPPRP